MVIPAPPPPPPLFCPLRGWRKKEIEKQVEMRRAKEGERWMRDVNHTRALKRIRADYGVDERRVRLLP